jgi:hypothetical protein
MDPITLSIIGALSLGATSGATDIAKKAIVDGYEGLKALIKKKFGGESKAVEAIEKFQDTPDSPKRKETLAQEMKAVNAAEDRRVSTTLRHMLTEFSEFFHVSWTGLLIHASVGTAGGLGALRTKRSG